MRNGDNYKPLDLARSLSEVRARGGAAAAVRLGELMRAGPPDTALAPGENEERVVAIALGAKGWFEDEPDAEALAALRRLYRANLAHRWSRRSRHLAMPSSSRRS